MTDAKCWDSVVDFRWHRTTPSPHWHVIPPLERIQGLPEEILNAGWSLIIPVNIEIESTSVKKSEQNIESNIESLIIENDNLRKEIKDEIVDEEEL